MSSFYFCGNSDSLTLCKVGFVCGGPYHYVPGGSARVDIRDIFDNPPVDRITSAELLDTLYLMACGWSGVVLMMINYRTS
jgi:hypothetical protein